MEENLKNKHLSDFLLPLILFFIFTILALMIVLLSAGTFNKVTSESAKNFDAGTSISYINQKIHSSDSGGNIHLGRISGLDALVIDREFAGSRYRTYIYEYDNTLRELFARADVDLAPESGQIILNITSLDFIQVSDNLIYVSCTDEAGNISKAAIALRSVS